MVYFGDITYTIDTNGFSIPIQAYSTTDNSSLTYELAFTPSFISLEISGVGMAEVVITASAPIGQHFFQVYYTVGPPTHWDQSFYINYYSEVSMFNNYVLAL